MDSSIDIAAYLDRIEAERRLHFLGELYRQYVFHMSFENLDNPFWERDLAQTCRH